MRNLKKALSLALASVMLLGMMVVGTSAATYSDVTDEHNVAALEVLNAVGAMVGADGKVNPDQIVTRHEAAVVISNLLDVDKADFAGVHPFTDVAAWADTSVGVMYAYGYTGGISATEFGGNNTLTTTQVSLMIMKALGYFQYTADLGKDWAESQLLIAKKANELKLYDGVKVKANDPLTRNNFAQIVLNALLLNTVQDSDISKDLSVTENGNLYNTYTYANPATGTVLKDKLFDDTDKLFYDKAATTDDYGYTADVWYFGASKNDDTKIGTYTTETADKTLVATKDGKSLQYWLETLDKDYVVAGARFNGTDSSASDVQLGAEINVCLDDNGDVEKVIVNTKEIVKVEKVTAATNKDYDYTVKLGGKTYTDDKLAGFDAESMEKDDYVTVLYKGATSDVLSVEVSDTVEGKITSIGKDGAFAVDGASYTKIVSVDVDSNALNYDDTYAFYKVNGYVYAAEVVVASDKTDGYVYVLDFATQAYNGSNLGIGGTDVAAKAEVLYLDGTIGILDMDIKKADKDYSLTLLENDYYIEFCGTKYEVADDMSATLTPGYYEYTLTDEGKLTLDTLDADYANDETVDAGKIVKDSYDLGDGYTANSSTKLVVIEAAAGDKTADVKMAESVGYKNFPKTAITTGAKVLFVYEKDSTVAKTVYILDTVTTNDTTYAYYTGNYSKLSATKTTYDFIINGETKTYELTTDLTGASKGDVYVVNEAAKTAALQSSVNAIVTEIDEGFFQTSAGATIEYADKCAIYDMTGETAVAGEVADASFITYVLNGSGEADVVYVIDCYITAQPETSLEAEEILGAEAGDWWSLWYQLPTLGLNQEVDGHKVAISGKLDAITATNFAEYKDAVSQWMTPVADYDAMIAALTAEGWDMAGVTAVGFVLLEVDGSTAVTMLVNQAGNVRCLKTAGTTLNWAGVEFDFAGLSF